MESLYLMFIIFTCMVVNVFVNKIDFLKGSHDRDLKILHLLKRKSNYICLTKKLNPPHLYVFFAFCSCGLEPKGYWI